MCVLRVEFMFQSVPVRTRAHLAKKLALRCEREVRVAVEVVSREGAIMMLSKLAGSSGNGRLIGVV